MKRVGKKRRSLGLIGSIDTGEIGVKYEESIEIERDDGHSLPPKSERVIDVESRPVTEKKLKKEKEKDWDE